jgi:hypothetical protein
MRSNKIFAATNGADARVGLRSRERRNMARSTNRGPHKQADLQL